MNEQNNLGLPQRPFNSGLWKKPDSMKIPKFFLVLSKFGKFPFLGSEVKINRHVFFQFRFQAVRLLLFGCLFTPTTILFGLVAQLMNDCESFYKKANFHSQ